LQHKFCFAQKDLESVAKWPTEVPQGIGGDSPTFKGFDQAPVALRINCTALSLPENGVIAWTVPAARRINSSLAVIRAKK
jgi:hypothetical protein